MDFLQNHHFLRISGYHGYGYKLLNVVSDRLFTQTQNSENLVKTSSF